MEIENSIGYDFQDTAKSYLTIKIGKSLLKTNNSVEYLEIHKNRIK